MNLPFPSLHIKSDTCPFPFIVPGIFFEYSASFFCFCNLLCSFLTHMPFTDRTGTRYLRSGKPLWNPAILIKLSKIKYYPLHQLNQSWFFMLYDEMHKVHFLHVILPQFMDPLAFLPLQ